MDFPKNVLIAEPVTMPGLFRKIVRYTVKSSKVLLSIALQPGCYLYINLKSQTYISIAFAPQHLCLYAIEVHVSCL